MRWFKKSKKSLTSPEQSPSLADPSHTPARSLGFGADLNIDSDPEGVLRSEQFCYLLS